MQGWSGMESAHERPTERSLSGYGNSTVRASDDVKVEGVTATIRAQGGAVLEEGAGVWSSASASWAYTTRQIPNSQVGGARVRARKAKASRLDESGPGDGGRPGHGRSGANLARSRDGQDSFAEARDRVLSSLPSILTRVSGRIGNVLFTNRGGTTLITRAPDFGPTGPTPERLAQAPSGVHWDPRLKCGTKSAGKSRLSAATSQSHPGSLPPPWRL
jgi:hypothetical protein